MKDVLSPTETKIYQALWAQRGQVVTYEDLEQAVWSRGRLRGLLRNYITSMRRKLGYEAILTLYGVGVGVRDEQGNIDLNRPEPVTTRSVTCKKCSTTFTYPRYIGRPPSHCPVHWRVGQFNKYRKRKTTT